VAREQHFHQDTPLSFRLTPLGPRPEVPQDSGPSRLLVASHEEVDFTGRGAERRELAAWLAGEAPRGMRLVTGPGGQGKTRLALRVGRDAQARRWHVLVARHRLDGGMAASGGRVEHRPGSTAAGVLVLVDYADRWPQEDLLALFADPDLQSGRVRVLLLGRSGDFSVLQDRLAEAGWVAARPLRLTDLPEGTGGRAAAFRAAATAFAGRVGVSEAALPGPPDLAGAAFALTLTVHTAALVGVLAVRDGLLAGQRQRLVADPAAASRHLIVRERRHWELMQERKPDPVRIDTKVMARAVLVATLTRGLPHPMAVELLAALDLGAQPQTVIDDHGRCYPPPATTVLEPLFPDRLGEDFVALVLPGAAALDPAPAGDPELAELADPAAASVVQRLLALTAPAGGGDEPGPKAVAHPLVRPMMTVLIETARRWDHVAGRYLVPAVADRPELAVAAGGAAIARLCGVPGIEATLPVIGAALDKIIGSGTHLDLDAGAVVVAEELATAARAGHNEATLARALTTLGVRLSGVGRREDALAPTQEATDIYRALAQANPAAYLPDLAMSLNNLGATLSEVGRRKDAVAPTQEATDLYRGLAQANPAAYLPDLAMSLNNLGNRLSEVGRREEALAPTQEATDIYRGLAQANPAAYLPDLAMSLNNLGATLSEVGRREEALAPAQEATDLYHGLAQANPAAYFPDLATSLWTVGLVCAAHGVRLAEGLVAVQEAVAILEPLAARLPAAFLDDLNAMRATMADLLDGLGRTDEAEQVRRQAG
jgi:tetratricopeptide (TPR) repeat protein